MEENDVQVLRLGLSEKEKISYSKQKVETNQEMSHILREARQRSKSDACYICGKKCSSFCNSHSVPRFALKQVATEGKVFFSGIQKELPFFGEDVGVNKAGTFNLICRECDSTCFQDYEYPKSYFQPPSGKILAQIAMKNYLQMISKRKQETALYTILAEKHPQYIEPLIQQLMVNSLDLNEYISEFKRAKIAATGSHDNWYYMFYYKKLDYVVPYAFQGLIAMICDFDGNIINKVDNYDPNYHLEEMHVAVFPFESSSIILMFIDSRNRRYRHFYRHLNKLPFEDQLSVINYIIHSYSENVFLSKNIDDDIFENKGFQEACRKTVMGLSRTRDADFTSKAVKEFDLEKRSEMPNLLSKEYAIWSYQ